MDGEWGDSPNEEGKGNIRVNSFNVAGSVCNAHSKYWHISLSIWLISLNWNIPQTVGGGTHRTNRIEVCAGWIDV